MSVTAPLKPDDQDSKYNPGEARARLRFSDEEVARKLQDIENHYNDDPKTSSGQLHAIGHTPNPVQPDPTQNISDTGQKERQPSVNRPWVSNVTGKSNGKKNFRSKMITFSKSPTGLVATTVVGGGVGIGGLLSPQAAIVHIKEVIAKQVDTMTSVNDTRAGILLKNRIFGTSAGCKIKVRCRFSGLSEPQMRRLKEQGAKLLDKNGNEVKPHRVGKIGVTRYSGGHTLLIPDTNGTGRMHEITAKNYLKAMRTLPELRDLTRSVHPSKWATLGGGKAAKFIRKKLGLTTDPKWGATDDEKETRKNFHESQKGQGGSGQSEVRDNAKYGDDGKPVDKNGARIEGLDDMVDGINEGVAKQEAAASAGEKIEPVPTDPVEVAAMEDTKMGGSFKNVFSKAMNFLSPIGVITNMCTVYQTIYMMTVAAKTKGQVHAARLSAWIMATIDKIKYGVADSATVQKLMALLQRLDKYGRDFGSSASYQLSAYGVVSGTRMTVSAAGTETVRLLTATMKYINDHMPGGGRFVRTTCKVATNPFVQGGFIFTSFIPGATQAAKAITAVIKEGGKKAVLGKIKSEVKKVVEKQAAKASQASVRSVAKNAGKTLWKMAKSPYGIFVASFLLMKYAVPWGIEMMSDNEYTIDMPGIKAVDGALFGTHAFVNAAGLESGGTLLTKKEYKTSFKPFNDSAQASYIADARAKSNPFDMLNPYSASNALASSFYMFSSKLNLQNGTANLLSLPATILSSLNPSNIISKTASADDTDVDSTFCKDDPYLDEHNLASMIDCLPIVGYPNISKLENRDGQSSGEQIADWMLANKQIDENDEPVPGSAYAAFEAKCRTDVSDKIIGDVGDPDQQLDPDCFGSKDRTDARLKYRIYDLDLMITDNMDNIKLNNTDTKQPTEPPLEDVYVPDTHREATVASTTPPPTIPSAACDNSKQTSNLATAGIGSILPIIKGDYVKKWEVAYAA